MNQHDTAARLRAYARVLEQRPDSERHYIRFYDRANRQDHSAAVSAADLHAGANALGRVCEYTGWHRPLSVTLTATSNQYLAPRLPLEGKLMVQETGTDGSIIYATFSVTEHDGRQSAFVAVPDARFTV